MREFRILGPLEVVDERGPLTLGGQKQRALLALLLIHAGETLPVDLIVDRLWGEQPPRQAIASLQNFVSSLRKRLGVDVLVTKSPGYAVRVEGDALDLNRFERLVSEARRSGAEERARKLHEALDLWRGQPLADLAYEAFVQGEIRRLEELRLEALEQRIDADLECGAGARARRRARVARPRASASRAPARAPDASRSTARTARRTRWRSTTRAASLSQTSSASIRARRSSSSTA